MIKTIKDYRYALGMTQQELANLLKCSVATVSGWECSYRNPPSYVLDYLELIVKKRKKEGVNECNT